MLFFTFDCFIQFLYLKTNARPITAGSRGTEGAAAPPGV